ncbi:MAG: riboflavin synthase [Candidatus Brocadiae bacterium]|nr:riboflavin synthase [Candidatus Brocadiia bacterium]
MFTGLIQAVGFVVSAQRSAGQLRLGIGIEVLPPDLKIGESFAVDGVCLTAVDLKDHIVEFDVVGETLKKTTLRQARQEGRVNLERALRADERLGGHFVTGHVDAIGRVEKIEREGGDLLWTFHAPAELMPEIAPKGSIAVDGISLTVVGVVADGFTVTIIPHTLNATTLGDKTPGDLVNLETDVLAKYVRRAAAALAGK